MKKIECIDCSKLLAEVEKGRVRPNIKSYCNKCWHNLFKRIDSYQEKSDLPDAFKDIFGGFNKNDH